METTTYEEKDVIVKDGKGNRKWLRRFLNFLMYGGWLLIIFVILGIAILVSVL